MCWCRLVFLDVYYFVFLQGFGPSMSSRLIEINKSMGF